MTEASLAPPRAERWLPLSAADVEDSIPAVFARRTAGCGERIAVSWGARELSYGALTRDARRVARAIEARSAGSQPGRVVLLLTDRIQQIVAALGVLESGQAFVPLDPSQPAARLAQSVSDAQATLIVAGRSTAALAHGLAADLAALPVLDLDGPDASDEAADRLASAGQARPGGKPRPDDVAYIMYTSGSTGGPKGVVQLHRNVLHSVREYSAALEVGPDDRFANLGSFVFGSPLMQIFRALLNGATICPYDVRAQGLAGLASWMVQQRISIYSSVPSLFRHWAEDLTGAEGFSALRLVVLGGEPVQRGEFEAFKRLFPRPCRFVCSLGMTEMPAVRRLLLDHDDELHEDLVPAGYAAAGTDVLVQDEQGRELGPGELGELVLRSRYLSPGYWQRPDLTAAAFRPDPADPGLRLFRTGDRGRLRADGCLEHLGRADSQVKLRGHRVETAEIEATILTLGTLRSVAVVPCIGPAGDAQLVAFAVAFRRREAHAAPLRRALGKLLPDYMIPARFVFRAALPQLPSGKLDRVALAAAAQALDARQPERATRPQDALQRQLTAIWERFLHINGIAPDDDFFELGGHSLIAVRIIARIQRDLGHALPLTALVESPTIAALAQTIRSRDAHAVPVPVLTLNAGGSRRPLFCLPGAGADAFALNSLGRALGLDQPVHALQWPGLYGHRQPESVEALAAWFVSQVRARQPQGPYTLIGTSFGGVVAYEMAQQLRAQGQEVPLLILLAANRPGHPALRPGLGLRARLSLARRWLLPRGGKDRWSRRFVVLGLREKLGRLWFALDRRLHPARAATPFRWRFTYVRELSYRAADCYRPRPYPGRTIIYRNEQHAPEAWFDLRDDLGWGELLTGPVELRVVPGAHGEELSPPSAALLARELKRLL